MKGLYEIIKWIISKLKLKINSAVFVSIVFVTILFIHGPWITNSCYIKLPDRFLIELQNNFEIFSITFKNKVFLKSYQIWTYKGSERDSGSLSIPIQKEMSQFSISKDILTLHHRGDFEKIRVDFFHSLQNPIELKEVYINGKEVNLKTFYDENIPLMHKEYVTREYIREYLSRFLLRYNDFLSNYILTFIFLLTLLLTFQLFNLFIRYNPGSGFKIKKCVMSDGYRY
jgi:hypothetical protein